jgi:hypothetical protein
VKDFTAFPRARDNTAHVSKVGVDLKNANDAVRRQAMFNNEVALESPLGWNLGMKTMLLAVITALSLSAGTVYEKRPPSSMAPPTTLDIHASSPNTGTASDWCNG